MPTGDAAASRCGQWIWIRQFWPGDYSWSGPAELGYYFSQNHQSRRTPGGCPARVPYGILQRIQPPAVQQSYGYAVIVQRTGHVWPNYQHVGESPLHSVWLEVHILGAQGAKRTESSLTSSRSLP